MFTFWWKKIRLSISCPNLDENKIDRSVDWLALPDHIISLVANKVINNRDYIRFGAVCTSWRGIYLENQDLVLREPVLLMLAAEQEKDGQTRSLYSFSENRFNKKFSIQIPSNKYCFGSTHGWVVTVSESYEVVLINPLLSSENEIQLPPLVPYGEKKRGRVSFPIKVVLSADPISNPNFMVMAIYGEIPNLYFYKPGDKAWTIYGQNWLEPHPNWFPFSDIIYHEDKFYALDGLGYLYECDVNDPSSTRSMVHLDFLACLGRSYLVKSCRDLLRVVRTIKYKDVLDSDYYFTDCHGFTVFKLDTTTRKWTELKSLNGRILFLGDNYSISLSVSDMPGCMPNCIYFTDDHHEFSRIADGGHGMGVFNMEDGSIRPLYPVGSRTVIPRPIFIQPITSQLSFCV